MGNQPESKLSRQIMSLLRAKYGSNIFIFKVHGSEYMMAGLPDLIGCINGQAFAIETKMPGNKPSNIQLHRHHQMRDAGYAIEIAESVSDALKFISRINPTLN
jgi:hypothetical protein